MPSTSSHFSIPDTQSESDARHLLIHRVGIKDIRYPFQLRIGASSQSTIGQWDLDVMLPADKKGTHMSRFVAWLGTLHTPLDTQTVRQAIGEMLTLLNATQGRIEVRFPFFLPKKAPVSGVESLLEYQGSWIAEQGPQGPAEVWAQAVVPVKSLCPCSKEISEFGAHNQRSHVTLRVELLKDLDWPILVRFAENAASSEIWPMLKRIDEKWVTERAYQNPKFVEDLVRDIALELNADYRVGRYSVMVENFESIHAHSAFAQIIR